MVLEVHTRECEGLMLTCNIKYESYMDCFYVCCDRCMKGIMRACSLGVKGESMDSDRSTDAWLRGSGLEVRARVLSGYTLRYHALASRKSHSADMD